MTAKIPIASFGTIVTVYNSNLGVQTHNFTICPYYINDCVNYNRL